jgi:hypothetical protein
MSDSHPPIPPVEQPKPEPAQSLENLEEKTLDKQAASATYRDAVERKQHLASLNVRISVLQTKLDSREGELFSALPRIAELEQAEKTANLSTVVEAVAAGGGAIALSVASFLNDDLVILKFSLVGAGISASAIAVFTKALFAIWGWPKKPATHS